MNTVVLVLGGRNGSRLDWRGSDKRHQAGESEIEELHWSALTVIGVVVVFVQGLKGWMMEKVEEEGEEK